MCCTRLYAARTTADPTVPTAVLVSFGCEHRHLLAWLMNTSSPLCWQVRLVNASPELHCGSASLHHRVCALGSETLKSRGVRGICVCLGVIWLKFLSCAVREIYLNRTSWLKPMDLCGQATTEWTNQNQQSISSFKLSTLENIRKGFSVADSFVELSSSSFLDQFLNCRD